MKGKSFVLGSAVVILVLAGIALGLYFGLRPAAAGPLTDDLGREISIQGVPQRVVSLNPAATEIMFKLGQEGKLVGVTDTWVTGLTKYPEDVAQQIQQLVNAGQLTALSYPYSAEAIADLDPDLVVVFGYTLPVYGEVLARTGTPVVALAPNTAEGVLRNIELIGSILGVGDEAKALTEGMRSQIAQIEAENKDKAKPRVFVETGYFLGQIWTTGQGSYISDLVRIAGGDDICAHVTHVVNPQISSEAIIELDPEVIILNDAPWGVTAASVASRTGWSELSAVQNGRVYELSEELADKLSRPGPRIVDALQELSALIHPE